MDKQFMCVNRAFHVKFHPGWPCFVLQFIHSQLYLFSLMSFTPPLAPPSPSLSLSLKTPGSTCLSELVSALISLSLSVGLPPFLSLANTLPQYKGEGFL